MKSSRSGPTLRKVASRQTPSDTGIPALRAGASVLFFGGSFDPPHQGHAALLDAAVKHEQDRRGVACPFDLVLIVPSAHSPLKATGPVASDMERVAMCRLGLLHAFSAARWNGARGMVWTDELDRAFIAAQAEGPEPAVPSYTYDTIQTLLAALRLHRKGEDSARISLLMGEDQAMAFHRWKEARALFSMIEPLVYLRGGLGWGQGQGQGAAKARGNQRPPSLGGVEAFMAGLGGVSREGNKATAFWNKRDLARWKAGIICTELKDVSSTDLRAALARSTRGTDETIANGLHPRVRAFIERRGAYRKHVGELA